MQRDWNEYSPDPDFPIALGAVEFRARSTFDNQENYGRITAIYAEMPKHREAV